MGFVKDFLKKAIGTKESASQEAKLFVQVKYTQSSPSYCYGNFSIKILKSPPPTHPHPHTTTTTTTIPYFPARLA
jgi:hypothetical protein